jgi:hypothetical protein
MVLSAEFISLNILSLTKSSETSIPKALAIFSKVLVVGAQTD